MAALSNATEVSDEFTLRRLDPSAQSCQRDFPGAGTIVCPGFEADLVFSGTSLNLTLRSGTTPDCPPPTFHVFLDSIEISTSTGLPAPCLGSAVVLQQSLPSISHVLGVINALDGEPLLISSALIEDYAPAVDPSSSTSTSFSAPVTPSSGAGPAPSQTASSSHINLAAVLVPTIVIPVLLILLALGFGVPWWRRRRRRQRALMAPSAAFRAENASMVAAGEAWTPLDAKRGEPHGHPDA
ncbi:hypothetical protein AURDEDRAFT_185823 [Auricularia subglabra TFB-10046 SS5]|nr:hypothetical protein AURDEDRAFT_185823 [Auricularia subglabra TFB-10046 SS5]